MTPWWKTGPLYQLLVPSFQDSNGDGIGDLPGILRHIDYFNWLGVVGIWLSPIYASPMREFGYDVSDYMSINPLFGTFDDFDTLVAALHERGVKIVLDWVPSHTSSEHAWFAASRSGRDHPQRDWYIWRDGKPDGSPPNNWVSVFGGSVWEHDAATGQFYCHTFLPEQPDLNWRHPDVRAAMHDAMRFWLRRGVDGFRIDAASWIAKDDQFRDNPPNPKYDPAQHAPDEALLPDFTRHQPYNHEIMIGMRAVTDEFDDRVLLGEFYQPPDQIATYFGAPEQPELQLPLNMPLAWTAWTADAIGSAVASYWKHVPSHGWPAWMLSGHDCPRLAERTDGEQTRIAAMLLATLPGTPIFYNGEEVGMRGVPIPPEQAIDPQGKRIGRNRDPERTPMQWNPDEPSAGFTTGTPWLPIGDDAGTANVRTQSDNPVSLLSLYRRLSDLRRHAAPLGSRCVEILSQQEPLLAYRRWAGAEQWLVVLNFSADEHSFPMPEGTSHGTVVLSTYLDREDPIEDQVHLRGHEGVIVRA
jgi:alpha-glucosidase